MYSTHSTKKGKVQPIKYFRTCQHFFFISHRSNQYQTSQKSLITHIVSNVNPTFPVFIGMGTVSWRRGSVCLVASIFLLFYNSSLKLPLRLWKSLSPPPLSISFNPQMCNLKFWSRPQKSGLSVHPWGCVPLSHSLSLTLLPVVSKEGASDEGRFRDTPPPSRLRAPSLQKPTAHFPNTFR